MSDDARATTGADTSDDDATVRVRGIYTTALTRAIGETDGLRPVQASPPIRERFDAEMGVEPADVDVWTTDDRQGVGVTGREAAVDRLVDVLRALGRDALTWPDPTPRGAVFAGEVTETLGSGAVVDLGAGEGFLPYSKTDDRVEVGDRLRVQVTEASAPWTNGRPVLDATVRVQRPLGTLVRGETVTASGPELADILPADPREGWSVRWDRGADDADLDALGATLDALNDRAERLDAALSGDESAGGDGDDGEGVPDPETAAPHRYWDGEATTWAWLGRETRFALDDHRDAVTATMAGHHRVKAATESASAAVDFVEAVCPGATSGDGDVDFPFEVVTRQFGPQEGDSVRLEHGKPDGRLVTLGSAEVSTCDADGTVVVRREMSPGGTYDGLGIERRAGDVAVTKLTEGKWWYPTVYRGDEGERRGTYVNVCTPVEVFPDAVRYVDLHVDVVKHADGTVERVDDDELDAAVEAGHVPEPLAEKARSVASALENAL
jgi:hypothetical protein